MWIKIGIILIVAFLLLWFGWEPIIKGIVQGIGFLFFVPFFLLGVLVCINIGCLPGAVVVWLLYDYFPLFDVMDAFQAYYIFGAIIGIIIYECYAICRLGYWQFRTCFVMAIWYFSTVIGLFIMDWIFDSGGSSGIDGTFFPK